MNNAFKITAVYASVASLWIIVSDRVIAFISDNVNIMTKYGSIKGIGFVAFTSMLLFIMIYRDIKKRNKIITELNKEVKIKEELNKELHHRIKNNIQVIIGIMRLETKDNDFSQKIKDRIIHRLISMNSVYNVVYNYENMADISLYDVLCEYQKISSRNINIENSYIRNGVSIEVIVTLLMVIDVILESIRDNGYSDSIRITLENEDVIDICINHCEIDLSTVLGSNENFVVMYLKSINALLEITAADPYKIRIHYRNRAETVNA